VARKEPSRFSSQVGEKSKGFGSDAELLQAAQANTEVEFVF
jgi:hypothetical protein